MFYVLINFYSDEPSLNEVINFSNYSSSVKFFHNKKSAEDYVLDELASLRANYEETECSFDEVSGPGYHSMDVYNEDCMIAHYEYHIGEAKVEE